MRKINIEEGNLYHIYNRGVEKRNIFMDKADRFRFLRSMYFCNDNSPANNSCRLKLFEAEPRTVAPAIKRRLLVKIHSFSLMPNHFHFLLEGIEKKGIASFMQKLGTAYTMYFNIKHERVGPLFQGSFKAVEIKDESYLEYLPFYIHANPLDMFDKSWRDGGVKDVRGACEYLKKYKWSSHLDYSGIENYPSIIDKGFLRDVVGDEKQYQNRFLEWLRAGDCDVSEDIGLE